MRETSRIKDSIIKTNTHHQVAMVVQEIMDLTVMEESKVLERRVMRCLMDFKIITVNTLV